MAKRRARPWHFVLAALPLAVAATWGMWSWDWVIPPVVRLAGGRLGRPVQIGHLHLRLAWNPVLTADDVVIGNPPGFDPPGFDQPGSDPAGTAPFARLPRLLVTLDGRAWWHGQGLVLPAIVLDRPELTATERADGRNNWTFPTGGATGAGVRIGNLSITDGHAHVVLAPQHADFRLDIATPTPAAGGPAQLVVQAQGSYADQPITARLVGGALLSLRDAANPWPIDLTLTNGATTVALHGSVQDPLAFAGTALHVDLAGKNLADLLPLTGLAAPATPPYRLTAELTYTDRRLRLDHLGGHIGSSDIAGAIEVTQGAVRPQITADLHARQVDLADFGGVIGGTPGRLGTPDQTAQQRAAIVQAAASPTLLPSGPLDLPQMQAADVTLHFRGEHIIGRSVPLDDVAADMTVVNGAVRIHPLSFGVGRGRITADIAADATGLHAVHTRTEVSFRQVDLARLLAATHRFAGAGTIGGAATLEGSGDSVAAILGSGNGELKLFMSGGELSALLVDLSGLEFGSALLAALGVPKQTPIHCLVADFALRHGQMETRTLLLDTAAANVIGKGSINLARETIDYQIRTEPKHFSIGSLPAPIDITGRLRHPRIAPDAKDVAIRGALAAGLGVLLTPLAALLPTIQLGLGADNNCGALIQSARRTPDPAGSQGQTH